MIDFEQRLAASLHADAERMAVRGDLAERARSRAHALRRRRRACVAAALAVVVAGTVALPRFLEPQPRRTPSAAVSLPAANRPTDTTLPALPGTAGAAEQPQAVATDPQVLHFDVAAQFGGVVTDWTSGPDHEGFRAVTASGFPRAELYLSRTPAALESARSTPMAVVNREGEAPVSVLKPGPREDTTVAGRPATLERQVVPDEIAHATALGGIVWVLRWQPVDGLYALAQVYARDKAAVHAAADALRLDRAQRCVSPIRLTVVPDGYRQVSCNTAVRTRPMPGRAWWVHSRTVWKSARDTLSVWAQDARDTDPHQQFRQDLRVGGHPAQWDVGGRPNLWIPDYGPVEVLIEVGRRPDALAVAKGLRVARDLGMPTGRPR